MTIPCKLVLCNSGNYLFFVKAVRLGHPARVMEKIHGYSLDAILDSSHDTMIVKDVRKDIDKALVCLLNHIVVGKGIDGD